MKKFLIILLTFVLSSNFCYASDDFDYGINKTTDISSNTTINFINTSGTIKPTTIDFVPLFNRSVIVPIRENVSALIRAFCEMCSRGYDSTAVYLGSYCGDKSNYTLTVSGNNYSLAVPSAGGEVDVYNFQKVNFPHI